MSDEPIDFEKAKQRLREKGRRRVKLLSLGEVKDAVREPDYVVQGRRETDTITVDVGEWGCGKSMHALREAYCIATGTPYRPGVGVKKGPVVYVAGEGHRGIAARIRSLEQFHGIDIEPDRFMLTEAPVPLLDTDSAIELGYEIQKWADHWGIAPSAIYFDTLARNFGPGEENSNKDMGAFVQQLDTHFRIPFRSALIVIHHYPRMDKTRIRGASALDGAADAVYTFDRAGEPSATDWTVDVKVGKAPKDFEPPPTSSFRFEPVTAEFANGLSIPSGLIVPVDTPLQPEQVGRSRVGGKERQALDVLVSLYDHRRQTLAKGGHPEGRARVNLSEWADACVTESVYSSKNPFYKTKDRLLEKGVVFERNGYIHPNTDHE